VHKSAKAPGAQGASFEVKVWAFQTQGLNTSSQKMFENHSSIIFLTKKLDDGIKQVDVMINHTIVSYMGFINSDGILRREKKKEGNNI